MATYCFTCPLCGLPGEVRAPLGATVASPLCACGGTMQRSYRREGVGVAVAELKSQRERGLDGESGRKAQRDTFLPTMEEFAGPGDPTGEKGMREWNDSHIPRPSNKKPLYPDVPKRTFAVS